MTDISPTQKKQWRIAEEATFALGQIVNAYIKEFFPKPLTRKEKITENSEDKRIKALTKRERDIDYLLKCSQVDEDYNTDQVKYSVALTIDAFKRFEYEANGDVMDRKEYRQLVDQITSILHIGRAYPDDAIRRLKRLNDRFLKGKKNDKQRKAIQDA